MTIDEAFTKFKPRKTLNKPLLLKVARKLRRLRNEEHYDQGVYVERRSCGTTACIAGWAVLLSGVSVDVPINDCADFGDELHDLAVRLLGISNRQAADLFNSRPDTCWPKPYDERMWNATAYAYPGTERPSRIAADLLGALANGKVKLG